MSTKAGQDQSEQFYRSNFFVGYRRESCSSPHYKFNLLPPVSFDWLKGYEPVARIGATLRLYHLPDRLGPAPVPRSMAFVCTHQPLFR